MSGADPEDDTGIGDVCLRCRKPVRRTGRRFGPRRVCPSCAPHYREQRACAACGRLSQRLVRTAFHNAPVCDACRNAIDHRNCGRCGHYRRVVETRSDGLVLCAGCTGPAPKTHACPDCSTVLPGGGAGRCEPCALRRRLERRIETERTRLATVRGHDVLAAYGAWIAEGGLTALDVRLFAVQAEALALLEPDFDARGRIAQDAVLDALGTAGAKKAQRLLDHLVETECLTWDHEVEAAWIERRRIRDTLAQADASGHGALLRAYHNYLVAPGAKPRKPRTLRMYLAVGLAFAKHAGITEARRTSNTKLLSFTRRNLGQKANLLAFCRYAEAMGAGPLTLPRIKRSSVRAHDKTLAARATVMRRRLQGSTTPAERRALVACLLANLFGARIKTVIALPRHDVILASKTVRVVLREEVYDLPDWLGTALREVMPAGGNWAFPGRGGRRPIAPASVWHHVRQDGGAARSPASDLNA